MSIVSDSVRRIFPDTDVSDVLSAAPVLESMSHEAAGGKVIPLDEFIRKGRGVCRHHCLLDCYLLSRLINDGLLSGEVIHHRQTLGTRGGHACVIFKEQSGRIYSLDSIQNLLVCMTNEPGRLNRFYHCNVEEEIAERYLRSEATETVPPAAPDGPSGTLWFTPQQAAGVVRHMINSGVLTPRL